MGMVMLMWRLAGIVGKFTALFAWPCGVFADYL